MTTEIQTRTRKWGDSLAVIIPKNAVMEEGLQIDDEVNVTVQRITDLSDLFGAWKTKKSAQELKDESRSGWK